MDDRGHFYKPIQPGPRGDRERCFYETVASIIVSELELVKQIDDSTPTKASFGAPTLSPSISIPGRQSIAKESFIASEFRRNSFEIAQRDELGLITATEVEEEIDYDDTSSESECELENVHSTGKHLMATYGRAVNDIGKHPTHELENPQDSTVAALLGQPVFDADSSLRLASLKADRSDSRPRDTRVSKEAPAQQSILAQALDFHRHKSKVLAEPTTRVFSTGNVLAKLPFTMRNAPLLRVIPRFYGIVEREGRILLELEDLTRAYRHPCIIDIKIGHATWYPEAEPDYNNRARQKDVVTTQSSLGFKICGMQVYRHGQGGYWRASKRWCKTLPVGLVDKALLSFAHNEHGLRASDVYLAPGGAVDQLRALGNWFENQKEFAFYSSSVLLLYEGDALQAADAKVRVRLVDFAHTLIRQAGNHQHDYNFLGGLRSLTQRLSDISRGDLASHSSFV